MVIADGAWVGVFDPKSNRNPTRYPLNKTPLALLLRDRLSLTEPGLVLGATRDGDGTDITVVDPRAPNEGRMVMSFSDRPVALRQWEITTKTGQRTRVALSDLTTGITSTPASSTSSSPPPATADAQRSVARAARHAAQSSGVSRSTSAARPAVGTSVTNAAASRSRSRAPRSPESPPAPRRTAAR